MDILYIVLILLSALIIGYLFGSISNGILISKKLFNDDVRNHGSGNAGGTNVGRVYGKKYGILCIVLDCLKTLIAIWLCFFLVRYIPTLHNIINEDYAGLVAALGAILGHCFPFTHGFKGGKAVACFGGICWASSWFVTIYGFIVFMLVLRIWKKVSLASIVASAFIALSSFLLILCPGWFMNFGFANSGGYITKIFYSCVLIVFASFLAYRHKENIKRLIAGTEKTVSLFDKKTK